MGLAPGAVRFLDAARHQVTSRIAQQGVRARGRVRRPDVVAPLERAVHADQRAAAAGACARVQVSARADTHRVLLPCQQVLSSRALKPRAS